MALREDNPIMQDIGFVRSNPKDVEKARKILLGRTGEGKYSTNNERDIARPLQLELEFSAYQINPYLQ